MIRLRKVYSAEELELVVITGELLLEGDEREGAKARSS
jgi:hypothetical protein